jgi:hypothetical protein
MHGSGEFPPRECGGVSVIGHVIPGWSEGLDPESRDSGFTLRVPRNDEEGSVSPRHARPCAGHPRLSSSSGCKDVDGRDI